MTKGIIFDLDDTLVDTSILRQTREARQWKAAVARVGETRLFPGVSDLLHQLHSNGTKIAVVTTSVSFYARAVMGYHRIEDRVLVAFHDAPPKPSPQPVLLALQKLGMEPCDVVGVGDSATDLASYRAAGIRAVGAGWSQVVHQGAWDAVPSSPLSILDTWT